MSISSEITRISGNVSDALTAISNKGVTVPVGSNSDDLATLIAAIPTGSGSAITITDTTDSHGGTIRTISAVDLSGITVTAAHLETGYTAVDAQGNTIVGQLNPGGGTINLQEKSVSYTPSETAQSAYVQYDSGYDGLAEVAISVGAISSTYVGSGITRRSSTDLSASGATVSVPAGYYSSAASKAVATGTAGTPTATKGTVSNHSVTVTPSVTNVSGYITGSTKTGTAVTVSASELVSGSETKTSNGTYDVTNLATLVVNVSGGSGKNVQVNSGSGSVRTTSYSSTGVSITVSKTGTYKVTWMAWKSSSQGTMGTNLYKNDTAGTNQTTWTNTYGQHIQLTNQSYTAGDVLTIYAVASSTSRYCGAGNLIIEEV